MLCVLEHGGAGIFYFILLFLGVLVGRFCALGRRDFVYFYFYFWGPCWVLCVCDVSVCVCLCVCTWKGGGVRAYLFITINVCKKRPINEQKRPINEQKRPTNTCVPLHHDQRVYNGLHLCCLLLLLFFVFFYGTVRAQVRYNGLNLFCLFLFYFYSFSMEQYERKYGTMALIYLFITINVCLFVFVYLWNSTSLAIYYTSLVQT